MGAAAATAQQPLTEVDVKNAVGVMYDIEAQEAFAAAAADGAVAWTDAEAHAAARTRPRLDARRGVADTAGTPNDTVS